MRRIGGFAMNLDRQPGELLSIFLRQFALLRKKLVGALELGQPDRGADVGHPIIIANHIVPVFAMIGQSLPAKVSGSLGELAVIADDHSTFSGRDRLVSEK